MKEEHCLIWMRHAWREDSMILASWLLHDAWECIKILQHAWECAQMRQTRGPHKHAQEKPSGLKAKLKEACSMDRMGFGRAVETKCIWRCETCECIKMQLCKNAPESTCTTIRVNAPRQECIKMHLCTMRHNASKYSTLRMHHVTNAPTRSGLWECIIMR